MEEINKQIGLNLKNIRKKYKLTQTDVGNILGVSFQQIQKFENGSNRITFDKMVFLSKELNFNMKELIKDI